MVCQQLNLVLWNCDHHTRKLTPASFCIACMLRSAQFLSDNAYIVVHSPDTDVLILLLHYSTDIGKPLFLDAGAGHTRHRISVNNIASSFSEDIMKALPGFHAFTRADCASAFVRKGKIKPFKTVSECIIYWDVPQDWINGTQPALRNIQGNGALCLLYVRISTLAGHQQSMKYHVPVYLDLE